VTATVLANALLADGRHADLRIEGGRVGEVGKVGAVATAGAERIDLGGALLVPGLVDGHIHLDKTLLGLPFQSHRPGDTVAERIAREKEIRRELAYPVKERALRLIRRVVAYGTTFLRSHVDIDSEVGLAGLEALLDVRESVRDVIGIELVAFPQSGIIADQGTAELLDEAIRAGADLVGGLDPAGIDNDIEGHLDVIFAIAARHGVGVDIHLHDPGDLGCFELRQIAGRAEALGLVGRVAVSHAFALGEVDDAEFGRTAEALARAGVAIMTNGPGPVAMPPIKRLDAAGVLVFAGSDNIRDAWSPYGNGDMLERAMLIGYRQGLRADEDLELCFDLANGAAASVLGLDDHDIGPGAAADLVSLPAASIAEAVAVHPARTLVMKRGRVVARDGTLTASLPI
jgi:cytosine/adenosine deaminase-related metal-dependent hydrolase